MHNDELVREAKHLAKNDALNEIFDRLTRQCVEQFKTSQPSESAVREEAFLMLRALTALRDEINAVAVSTDVSMWNRRLRGSQV